MQIDTLREHFAHPPVEFGPTPFWFLNDELDEKRLRLALEEMKAKGIAGVMLHPRSGLEIEYLSDAFWEKLRFICETLKRLGMKGWIYDEYNWPSGPVGGKILREHPAFKQFGLDYRTIPASQIQKYVRVPPGEIVAAFSITESAITDKTDALKSGSSEAFSAGKALIFFLRQVREPMAVTRNAPWTKGERGYLDLLNPAAVDEFMRLTHFEYDRHLKDYYGSTLVGIFTDEPENYCALPYTRRLPEIFRERYSRDFRDAMPSLAGRLAQVPVENHIRNRTQYFELARDLYVESFFQKISKWASERGLIFTGHLMADDDIHSLPATNVSFYAPLSRMQMPGIDLLSDKHGFEKEHPVLVHANFAPKALASVAHHIGAERALCEIWGGNGWASSPEKLKAMLNWVEACGINFINPHAAFLSLRGHRKRDWPASHFPPQPWWRFYDKFSEYIARLSFLNSRGAHVAPVLFAFPSKSLWAQFNLRTKADKFSDLIEAVSEALLRNHLDFDYLFDEVLDSGAVGAEEGKLTIRGEKYSLLLLPVAPAISRKQLELAERFAAAGGGIVAFGHETPQYDEYGTNIFDRSRALFTETERRNVVFHQFGQDAKTEVSRLVKAINERISPDLAVEGEIASNLIYLHRRLEGSDIYFVANLSDVEGQVDLRFRCKGRPQMWNPDNGEIKDVLVYRTDEENIFITARFQPNQSMFYVIADEPPVDHVDSTNLNLTSVTVEYADGYTSALEVRLTMGARRFTRTVEQALLPIFLPDRWEIVCPVKNIMVIDQWNIDILSDGPPPEWSPWLEQRLRTRGRIVIEAVRSAIALARGIKKTFGLFALPTTKFEPMDTAMDVANRWARLLGIDSAELEPYEFSELMLNLSKYAGFLIGYDFPPAGSEFAMSADFYADHIPDDLALIYESSECGPRSVRLNGRELEEQPERFFVWDSSNVALPIARHVRKGRNRLRLEWRQPSYQTLFPSVHGIEPVCLSGTFWVKEERIVEQKYGVSPMPWSQVGFPNYIGSLTYRSSFDLPMKYMGQQLFLKLDRIGVAAEVKVNGKTAGVLLWRPYTLDVTELLNPGENTIEVTVANTAANLLGQPQPAGLIGRPYVVPYWRHRIRFA